MADGLDRIRGNVSKLLSNVSANADGTAAFIRQAKYGEQIVRLLSVKNSFFAEEGSSYMATTPTVGTGVALGVAAATAVVQTAPSILLYNNDALGGKNIIMDSIKLIVTGAGTAGTRLDCSIFVDTTVRYTSGGTAATPVNANVGVASASIAKFYDASSAIVSPAASSNMVRIARLLLRSQIPVVMDQYYLDFGGATYSGGITNGTAPLAVSVPVPTTVIGPQQSLLVFLHSASQSAAPTYEYDVVWTER